MRFGRSANKSNIVAVFMLQQRPRRPTFDVALQRGWPQMAKGPPVPADAEQAARCDERGHEPFLWLLCADYRQSDLLYLSDHSCTERQVAGRIAIGWRRIRHAASCSRSCEVGGSLSRTTWGSRSPPSEPPGVVRVRLIISAARSRASTFLRSTFGHGISPRPSALASARFPRKAPGLRVPTLHRSH